jgi:hypothetical protein
MALPDLVIFYGGSGGSPVEETLADALAEDTLDTLEKITASGAVKGAILVTDRPEMARRCPPDVRVDVDDGRFHFGERLAAIISRYSLDGVIYLGAGSAPLMTAEDFFSLGHYLGMAWNMVLTNNFHSADLVAFIPGEALLHLEPPNSDNALPRLLRDQGGLASQELPRSTATQFNIDSPADLLVLKLFGGAGPRLQAWLNAADWDVSRQRDCLRLFTDPGAEVLVAGRVGSQVWQVLEQETACRVRVFSEERGMQAAGREESGQARSILGFHLQEVGCERFFQELAELAQAAFIDTRVILAHLKVHPSRADRFLSDLGRYEEINDPFLRQLTEAAAKAPIPVLLGGHSLVGGGLMALIEKAWREHEQSAGSTAAG